jgi:hypothetical protein
MRVAAFVVAGILGAASTVQAQYMYLPMQQFGQQVQAMQQMYQNQMPFQMNSAFNARASMAYAYQSADANQNSSLAPSLKTQAVLSKILDETMRPAPTPTFWPKAGSYNGTVTVTISDAAPGSTIYYTLDGTQPQYGSAVYTGPIKVSQSAHLVAIAIPAHRLRSASADASYEVAKQN